MPDRGLGPQIGRSARCRSISLVPVLLTLSLVLMVPFSAASTHPGLAPYSHTVVRQQFAGTIGVYELASVGQHVLVVNSFPNGSQELVMFDPAHNSTKVVEAVNPTGTFPAGVAGAGGSFLVGWTNTSTGHTQNQSVTLAGAVTSLPVVTAVPWTFPYANSTALFATVGSDLWEVNPSTLAIVHNYSSKIPAGVNIEAVLPVGPRLYVSGSEPASNGSASPYFGFLNRTSHAFHSLTTASTTFPANLRGSFYSMLELKGIVYPSGADEHTSSSPYAFHPVADLFDAFDPSSASLTNQSALLPHASWGVYALELWNGRVALSLSDFSVNPTGSSGLLGGGLFSYKVGGTSLTNITSLWGPNYLANVFAVTAETGGYLTSAGETTASGISEVVSVRT